MNALDNAKKHFESLRGNSFEVPEWGDENGPLVIYSEPCTLVEKGIIKERTEKNEIDGLVYVLILKAKDAQGNPLFTLEDKQALKTKVDPDVLSTVASKLMVAPKSAEMLD